MHFKNGLKNETVKTSKSGLIGLRRNPTTHLVFSLSVLKTQTGLTAPAGYGRGEMTAIRRRMAINEDI